MISSILTRLPDAAPYLIVYAAGAVLAARRMQRHPGPSRFVLLACAVLIAGVVAGNALCEYFDYMADNHRQHETRGEFIANYAWIIRYASAIGMVSRAAGMALLLKAVYADRDGAGREAMPEESGGRCGAASAAASRRLSRRGWRSSWAACRSASPPARPTS
jgi:hypothetical protein